MNCLVPLPNITAIGIKKSPPTKHGDFTLTIYLHATSFDPLGVCVMHI